jgi:hypothetical protein
MRRIFMVALAGCTVSAPAANDLSVPDDLGSGPTECMIEGTTRHAGELDPANPCLSCQPARSPTTWSSIMNGIACGTNQICSDGSCESTTGCNIGGMQVGTGMANPADPCQVCRPSTSASDWSPRPDGTSCGSSKICADQTCTSGCFIDGTVRAAGAADPANACRGCQPALSTSAFSAVADGTSCGGGKLCLGGDCVTAGCVVNGAQYQPGDVNPQNPCQSCQPATSAAQFTTVADGTACNGNMVCVAGSCITTPTHCTISGQSVAAGTIDRGNLCRACQPAVSLTQFSELPDGTACNITHTCIAGTCTDGCKIGGIYYTSGYLNPANPCQSCDDFRKATDWTTLADGSSCGSMKQCNTGTCYDHCNIQGSTQPVGAVNPGNACLGCQPGVSLTAWTPLPTGVSCGSGGVCSAGTCLDGCTIDGMHRAIGEVNPQNSCQECQPILSLATWSDRAFGTSCGINHVCYFGGCAGICKINGSLYFDGDPVGNCNVCKPSISADTPQPAPDGTLCFLPPSVDMGSSFGVCHTQVCELGCFIDGTFRAAGAVNPDNPCLGCNPQFASDRWTGREGVGCGLASFCDFSGFCRFGCSIGGHFYFDGQSVGDCTLCNPVISTSVPQPAAEGSYCDFGSGVCHNQTCQNGCFFAQAQDLGLSGFVPAGTARPGNPCQVCEPPNTTYWSTAPNGTVCGAGKFCSFGSCEVLDMSGP